MYHKILDKVGQLNTPCYCYDLRLLRSTLNSINHEIEGFPFVVHYAVKANANPVILKEFKQAGLGVDLVSGNEIKTAVAAGFGPELMAFAGVGKSDWEIEAGLESGI